MKQQIEELIKEAEERRQDYNSQMKTHRRNLDYATGQHNACIFFLSRLKEIAKVEATYKKYLAEEKKINLNAPIYLGNQFCKHTFIQSDIQWMKCTCCGQIEPFKIKS